MKLRTLLTNAMCAVTIVIRAVASMVFETVSGIKFAAVFAVRPPTRTGCVSKKSSMERNFDLSVEI